MDTTGVIAAIGAAGSLISIGTVLVQTDNIIGRLENVEQKVDRLDQRLDRVEDKVDRHVEYHLPQRSLDDHVVDPRAHTAA